MKIDSCLAKLDALEVKLRDQISGLLPVEDSPYSTLFLGAAGARSVFLVTGFKEMVAARNFQCAAIILRSIVDTMMRINAVKYLTNREADLEQILIGKMKFRDFKLNDLESVKKQKMLDKVLLERLGKDLSKKGFSGISEIYDQLSDFVHFSSRHVFTGIVSANEADDMVVFNFAGRVDGKDESFVELCDHCCTLTCALIEVMGDVIVS